MNGANIGKIAGGIGLVLLLSSPFTWFLTSGSPWLGIVKVGLGAALVAAYLSFEQQLSRLRTGVLELKALIFFTSVIALSIFVTHRRIEAFRWT